MKTEYRIIEQTTKTKKWGRLIGHVFIAEYRNLWTLKCWKKIHPFAYFDSIAQAEAAIDCHRGKKTIRKEIKRFD